MNAKRLGQHCAIAALILGLGLAGGGITHVAAQPDSVVVDSVNLTNPANAGMEDRADIRHALTTFVRGMAEGDAKAVWMYASEEDQAAFGTEEAVLAAFADAFPALTEAQEINFESFRDEGDTPFVVLSFADQAGTAYQAEVGLWLDDAGDWKVVSCEVTAVSDRVASL